MWPISYHISGSTHNLRPAPTVCCSLSERVIEFPISAWTLNLKFSQFGWTKLTSLSGATTVNAYKRSHQPLCSTEKVGVTNHTVWTFDVIKDLSRLRKPAGLQLVGESTRLTVGGVTLDCQTALCVLAEYLSHLKLS